MRAGRGRTAAIAAAAAIATSSQSNRRSHTPTSAAAATTVTTSTSLPSNTLAGAASSGNKTKQNNPRLEKVNKKYVYKKNDESGENEKIIKISKFSTSATIVATTTTNLSSKKFLEATSAPTTSLTIQSPLRRGRKQTLTPAIEHEKMHVDEDLSDYNLVTARARRTPKPNPKYAREDMVSSYAKSVKDVKSDEESEQGDFVDSADDFEIHSGDMKEEGDFGETDEELEEDARRRNKLVSKLRARSSMQQRSNTEFISPGNKRKLEDNGSKEFSIKPYNKHVKIDMYDASDSDVSIPSPNTSQRIMKNVVKSTGLSTNRQTSLLRPLLKSMQNEMPKSKPIQILERRKDSNTTLSSSKSSNTTAKRVLPTIRRTEDDDVQIATTATASTVDDFETMPTFTIVNINDIINKKNDDILKLDAVNLRNKTHTVLSQKADVSPPRSPFSTRKSGITLNNNVSKPYLKSSADNINTSAPPRILNSVVGRKTRPVSPIVRTKDVVELPISTSPPMTASPYIKRNLKENVSSSSPIHIVTTPPHKPTTIANRPSLPSNNNNNNNNSGRKEGVQLKTVTKKFPNDRVFVQKQGNKLVKKVTCFETWYVINLPLQTNTTEKQQRKITEEDYNYILDMSLVELGNRIKEVQLPAHWNYKVTLQKLSPAQMNFSDLELYMGDLNDPSISDEDKIKYHPVNIMFRRMNRIKNRIPYDRSVTFKNNKYFLNIDGKHICLCDGAPTVIKSIDDISILLEILNDLTLNSEFVEQLNLNIL